ncbi:MAG TPA: SDR family oxidoreductase [Bacteroidales bacterium]|nr:SDR family oxidoreductase [Bacteroidales bacterium]
MHKLFDLSGKTFLVTGASSGIGRQCAATISECGGTLIISGRNAERLNETFLMLKGDGHKQVIADLSTDEAIENLADGLPPLNGLVHCAGITAPIPVKFIRSRHIDDMMRVNYYAPVLLTTRILSKKKLLDHSSIVFFSTIATKFPYYGGSLYISSKSALSGFSMVLALELAPKGIRSNCLLPGFVRTPMYEATEEHASPEAMKKFEMLHPLGIGDPEDVAGPVCFLLSDASRWITGINIPLGGSL